MSSLFRALLLGSFLLSPLAYGGQLFQTNLQLDKTSGRMKGVIYAEWRTAHRFCLSKGFDAGARSYSTQTNFDRIRRTRSVKIDHVHCASTQRELGKDALRTRRAYYLEKKGLPPVVKHHKASRKSLAARARR